MKVLNLVLVLIGLITFFSCEKEIVVVPQENQIIIESSEKVIDTVWMYYDETFCANSWGGSYSDSDSEEEKKTNIENYFIDLEIELFEIKKTEVSSPETFFLCVAKTGYVIEFKIREEDANTLINEGFHQ